MPSDSPSHSRVVLRATADGAKRLSIERGTWWQSCSRVPAPSRSRVASYGQPARSTCAAIETSWWLRLLNDAPQLLSPLGLARQVR